MEPASTIIKKLGGATLVSKGINVHRTRVYKWMWPKERQGTGGIIPHWQIPKILNYAKKIGVPLSEYDFVKKIPQERKDSPP